MHISENLVPIVAILCAVGGPFVFLSIASVCSAIVRISKNRGDAQLKAIMIERGMSAAEIETVLAAPLPAKKKNQKNEIPAEKPIMAHAARQAW